MAGAIADEQLMLQQQRLCSDGTEATWPEESRKGDEQVDGEDEEFAHGANRTMTASARKTAPRRRIPSYYEFATDNAATAGMARADFKMRFANFGVDPTPLGPDQFLEYIQSETAKWSRDIRQAGIQPE